MYEKKNPNKLWYLVIGVVVGTLLLLGILALLMKSMNSDEETGTTETGTTVSTEKKTEAGSAAVTEKKTEVGSAAATEKKTEAVTVPASEVKTEQKQEAAVAASYRFRSKKLKDQHYQKHGIEMGYADADAYEAAANEVVSDPSSLHKTEKEDGDDVYYRERDNAFVVVSTDGYIRTYFYPNGGKAYFDKQ